MPKIDDGNGRVFFAPSSQVKPSPPVVVAKFDDQLKKAKAGRPPVDPATTPTGQTTHIVNPGESLITIAQEAHISVESITKNNDIRDANHVPVGLNLVLVDSVRQDAMEQQRLSLEGIEKLPKTAPAQAMREEAWQGVQQQVVNELAYVTRNGATPQEALDEAVEQIKQRAPDSARLSSAVDGAKALVEANLKSSGRTHENFDAVLSKAQNAQTLQGKADALNKRVSAGENLKAEANSAQQDAASAWTAVSDTISGQVDGLKKGKDAGAFKDIVVNHLATLVTYGPDDAHFRSAIEAVTDKVLIGDAAKGIADAYATGGAPAAAFQARNTVESYPGDMAAKVLERAAPTMDRIAVDLGREFREKDTNPTVTSLPTRLPPETLIDEPFLKTARADRDMKGDNTVAVVMGDLAAAYEPLTLNPDANLPVLQHFAGSLARALPDADEMKFAQSEFPLHDVTKTIQWSASQSGQHGLFHIVSSELAKQGRGAYAENVESSLTNSVESLRKHALDAGAAFSRAREPFASLADGPAKLIDPAKQTDAMMAARKASPDLAKKFDESLTEYRRSGHMLWSAQASASNLQPVMAGQKGFSKVQDALAKPGANDNEARYLSKALELGADALVNLVANDNGLPRTPALGTPPWYAVRANLDMTTSFIENAMRKNTDVNSLARYDLPPNQKYPPAGGTAESRGMKPVQSVPSDTGFGLTNRLSKTVLAGFHVNAMFQFDDFWSNAYGMAFSTTVATHGAEALGGVTQMLINLNRNKFGGGTLDSMSQFVRAENEGWVKWGGVSAKGWFFMDAAYSISNVVNGDLPHAAIFGAQTIADGLFVFARGPWVGPVAMVIGALAGAANTIYGEWKAEDARQTNVEAYLKGADIQPKIAERLTKAKDAPARIEAFAQQWCQCSPVELVNYINALPTDRAMKLLQFVIGVPMKPDGKGYALTAPNDFRFNLQRAPGAVKRNPQANLPPVIPVPDSIGQQSFENPPYPYSITAIGLWAFENGYDLPGRYHQSTP
ncbi:LysM peptidoglycan-binding domain-containing protein [Phyllobacterium myrsinacearum]|uniref:LysM repeat protein n=1 Tax=Phyllobacterium myrsinacearum TaxID=28101 RepID=A0A839ESX7_9HYPH|nr:LysM domain-containing protein [Phyllobacterium myrsinacearum]MBA8879537.1 LysM repeat protein [Phyllobacterium myrsinacearum]